MLFYKSNWKHIALLLISLSLPILVSSCLSNSKTKVKYSDQHTLALMGVLETLESSTNQHWNAKEWYLLGNTYIMLGAPTNAIRAYKRACTLDPNEAWYFHDLALTLASVNDTEEAVTVMENAKALSRDDKKVLGIMENALESIKNMERKRGRVPTNNK